MSTINNLQDIFLQIDKGDYSAEEKERIKGSLTKVDSELRSLGGLLKIAAPWVQLLLNIPPKLLGT